MCTMAGGYTLKIIQRFDHIAWMHYGRHLPLCSQPLMVSIGWQWCHFLAWAVCASVLAGVLETTTAGADPTAWSVLDKDYMQPCPINHPDAYMRQQQVAVVVQGVEVYRAPPEVHTISDDGADAAGLPDQSSDSEAGVLADQESDDELGR